MAEHEFLGSRIGHIRVVDFLAKGGMGAVYVGFDEKLQRKVALKVLNEGILDAEARARFAREARVLSQLRHPNICQIFDFLEEGGREFLVLELIDGQNLKDVIASHPDMEMKFQIARQFAGVLAATHARGVIHRDLKPQNVMLTPAGDVKVLDFGVARESMQDVTVVMQEDEAPSDAAEGKDASASVGPPDASVTRMGAVVGTLSYMSPEQARGEHVTAASDMYSYGLVLQELFTGRSAYPSDLTSAEQLAAATMGRTLPVSGLDRGLTALITRLKDLAPAVRPSAIDTLEHLDWIHDRPRRRLRRMAAWAGAAALALVAGGMSYQAYRIEREAKRANREADAAHEVSEFLVKLFEVSDPSAARGESVTARSLLDKAATDLKDRMQEQPELKARMLDTLSRVYTELGLYDSALGLAEESLKLRSEALPAGSPAIAESLRRVGILHDDRGEYDQAEPLYKRALAIYEKAEGPKHPDVATVLTSLAIVYDEQGKYDLAEPLYQRALGIDETAQGAQGKDVARDLHNLATLYQEQGKNDKAEPLLLRALAIDEKVFGANHPRVAKNLNNLAALYQEEGKHDRAEPLFERALKIDETALGPEHPDVARDLNNLATLYLDEDKADRAEPLYRRALAVHEKALGPDHPSVASDLGNIALLHDGEGDFAQAEPLYERALKIDEAALGPEHPDVARSLASLANLYEELGNTVQAEPLYERALKIDETALGKDHPSVASDLVGMAKLAADQGKLEAAEPLLVRALKIDETAQGPSHPDVARDLGHLAALYLAEGKPEGAEPLYRRALKIQESSPAASRAETAGVLVALASIDRSAGGKDPETLRRALAIFDKAHPRRVDLRVQYARALLMAGRNDDARRVADEAYATGYRRRDLLDLRRELPSR